MWDGVVDKLGRCQELGPIMGVVGTKDPKIGLYFLIGSFGLAVSLRVISGGKTDIIMEDSSKFSGESRSKLWATIRDKRIV
jgi:hypothetical protein